MRRYDECPLCGNLKRTKNKRCAGCWARKRGDTLRHSEGYVLEYAPEHPRAHNGYVYQHILVFEAHAGRPVREGYHVHHLNDHRSDNRLVNLAELPAGTHQRLHMTPERAREMQVRTVEARHRNGTYGRSS